MTAERLPQPGDPEYDPRAERIVQGLGDDVVSLDDVRAEGKGNAPTADERFVLKEEADVYRVIADMVAGHPDMMSSKAELRLYADAIAKKAGADVNVARGVIDKLPENFAEEILEEKAA